MGSDWSHVVQGRVLRGDRFTHDDVTHTVMARSDRSWGDLRDQRYLKQGMKGGV